MSCYSFTMFIRKVLNLSKLIRPTYFRRYNHDFKNVKCSYSFNRGSVQLTAATVGEVLDNTVSEAGDQPAFVFSDQGIEKTFYEFQNDVDKLASGLLALGLNKGDRIGICTPNVYEWPVAQFAAARAGFILACINPASQARELEYFLNKVECKALIVSDTYRTQDFYKLLCSFIPELPVSKPGLLSSQKVHSLKSIILTGGDSQKPKNGTFVYEDLMNYGDSKSRETLQSIQNLVQFDDPVHILFTSGTTGNPKAAVLSHHNVVNNALIIGKKLGHDEQKAVVGLQLPLYHCFGCVLGLLATLMYKNPCVVPSPGFDAMCMMEAVEKYKCTTVYGAPTMFVDMVDKYVPGKSDLSSVRQVILGGAPSTESLLTDLHEYLNIEEVRYGYGTTETSPGIATVRQAFPLSPDNSGYMPLIDHVEVKIIDTNGHVVPVGGLGEICTRGHHVFQGYWDNCVVTKAVDSADWYHTGDLGKLDERGHVKITGRIKDMIIRGGENLYPAEIENVLNGHPSVLEVHICGVPDVKMGEEMCAWVKVKGGDVLTEDNIKEYLTGKISHFKIPRYILFVDDFPKTGSGKVQKFKMAEDSKERLKL